MTADVSDEVSGGAASAKLLAGFDRDVLLATGRSIRVRASHRGDLPALRRFYDGLSDRSTYLRFFGVRPALPDERLSPSGGQDVSRQVVLVALDGGELIGVGEYFRVPGQLSAEVAFAVADSHQGMGIGTVLLEDLALIAKAAGLTKLVAETLAGNDAMLLVFRSVGLVMHSWYDSGEVRIELDLTGESLLEDHADGRDWTATVASLQPVFAPRHVVVIGASRTPGSPGRMILDNLRATFSGRVSVVHPVATSIGDVPAVANVGDLDAVADLAVIAVPASQVVDVVDECGRAGVRAAVVISAGFAEEDDAGAEREAALVSTARRYGMRIVGPNCLGVVSTAAGLNATFLGRDLRPGSIAIASQSGGVGVIVADEAARRGLGVSAFVSMGNKADVSGNDLLRYWSQDPGTSVVLMYLESIGDPRRFARIARAVSRRLPVVALKGGRSAAGKRAASSHTAALAADDSGIDALFAHTGVVRADTLDQLLDVGALLVAQPAPAGRRLAVIGNAGGPLILATDAAEAVGLDVVELSAGLQERLREIVPQAASLGNPIDLLATVSPAQLRDVLDAVADSGEVDACAVVSVNLAGEAGPEPLPLDWSHPTVPAVAVLLAGARATGSMPVYPTPERAVEALACAAERGVWLARVESDRAVDEPIDILPVRRELRRHADRAGAHEWLDPRDTFAVLGDLAIPVAAWGTATTVAGVVAEARRIGFPCVLKADVLGVVHKSDSGAVVLGLESAAAARRAASQLVDRFGERLRQVVVQRQASGGVELLVGGVRDPAIGPLVVVAAGGTDAEVLRDRSVVLAPVTPDQARRAIEDLRLFPLLDGFRGRPVVPIDPIVEIVRRIGLLMATVPEVAELDLNPLIAGPDGCVVVDARIAVAPLPLHPLRALRGPRPRR